MDRHDGFEALFEEYRRAVCYFFGNRGLSREDACDLAQETFLEIYKSLHRLEHREEPKGWILTIAKNLWLNWIRSRKTIKRAATEIGLQELDDGLGYSGFLRDQTDGPLDDLLDGERKQRLRRAFDGLPPQRQQCMLLRYEQGLKLREIAAVMQISIQTVKSHLFQAKQSLRKMLTEDFEIDGDENDER